jgi:thiol-disulfide isomerase/thioredoxin
MVKTITDTEFEQEIKSNDRVVIKYYADWCGTCRLIAPKFKKMSETDDNQGIDFIEVNAEKNPAARKWGSVSNLPYFAVVKNGELVETASTGKEERVMEMIDKIR